MISTTLGAKSEASQSGHLSFDDHVLLLLLLDLGWTYQQIQQETGILQEILVRYDPRWER